MRDKAKDTGGVAEDGVDVADEVEVLKMEREEGWVLFFKLMPENYERSVKFIGENYGL